MARYIDADKLWNDRPQMSPEKSMEYKAGFSECLLAFSKLIREQIDNPAADVEPKSEGEWNTTPRDDTYPYFTAYSHTCSKCTYTYYDVRKGGYKFCPNCGAKMTGGIHET